MNVDSFSDGNQSGMSIVELPLAKRVRLATLSDATVRFKVIATVRNSTTYWEQCGTNLSKTGRDHGLEGSGAVTIDQWQLSEVSGPLSLDLDSILSNLDG